MIYRGQRYPEDGPALAKLSSTAGCDLRRMLGDGGLFRLEIQLLADEKRKEERQHERAD